MHSFFTRVVKKVTTNYTVYPQIFESILLNEVWSRISKQFQRNIKSMVLINKIFHQFIGGINIPIFGNLFPNCLEFSSQ